MNVFNWNKYAELAQEKDYLEKCMNESSTFEEHIYYKSRLLKVESELEKIMKEIENNE